MKIFDFVKSLLPSFEKNRIIEDVRITISELENNAVSSYSSAADYFNITKPKSPEIKSLSDDFYRNLSDRVGKQPTMFADIYKRLPVLIENLKFIQKLVETEFEKDILRDGLTARKVILVRAVESFGFISGYLLDLLNYAYVKEMAVGGGSGEYFELSIVKIKEVETGITNFAKLLSEYAIKPEAFKAMIGDVPAVVLNERTEDSVSGVYKEAVLDPFNTGHMSGFRGNPYYHVGLMVAEWQAGRYKANKDKKKVLELRLLQLRLKNEKKSDPKLEQEITYIQSRVDKLERELKRVEEDARRG